MPNQVTDPKTVDQEKATIRKIAGLVGTQEIVLNDRGWDSRVYSFENGRYYFKFPRSEKVQGRYKYEIEAIKAIASLDSPVKTQKIIWETPDNAYFGYEGIEGKAVSEILQELDLVQKQKIGTDLGAFLKEFHGLKLDNARTMSIDEESQQIQRWYQNSLVTIKMEFSEDEEQRLHQLVYEEWPARLNKLGCELVLCHGDLHFENTLFSDSGELGLIDFGDVAYFDRSKDFLEISEEPDIYSAVIASYGHIDTHLKDKIAVRQAMIQIINLGFHAGKNDRPNTKLTANKIRSLL